MSAPKVVYTSQPLTVRLNLPDHERAAARRAINASRGHPEGFPLDMSQDQIETRAPGITEAHWRIAASWRHTLNVVIEVFEDGDQRVRIL